ncbi:MAG: S41 family peptidase [Paludibacteraceae bacterium]|nr:S41 family peptidase [Paludibacteraceae bacterium]
MKNKYPIIASLALALGITLGVMLPRENQASNSHNSNTEISNTQVSTFPMGSNNFNKLNYLLFLLKSMYVDSIKTEELTEKIIPLVLEELDPHSTYVPKDEVEMANDDLEGSFSGIGVQFNIQNDTIMVVDVISGGPSEKVGILPGDRIIEVNDSSFVGKDINNNKVLKTLRGKKDTKVNVGIKRNSSKETLYFTITRGDIPVNSVDIAYPITPKIGYIKVSRFGANTYNEFVTELTKLKKMGCEEFMIDLRYNSGGYLHAAIKMINEFLEKGELIVYTEGRSYPREDAIANGKGMFKDIKVCVLINEWSASASEIFAGAIQDQDRGIIIGRRSFGKGLVQQQMPLLDGSEVRLTIAHYYTPSGRSIQKPYEGGNLEEYEKDILNRYEHGEFFSSDSIVASDSIKYYTKNGRVVYGGGGIMPDYFVPQDTTSHTPYYTEAQNKGYIYSFAFQYSDKNRSTLKKFKDYNELCNYLDKENINLQFYKYAESKGLTSETAGQTECADEINNILKAYICRNIIGDKAFYPILNSRDETIIKALEVMGN